MKFIVILFLVCQVSHAKSVITKPFTVNPIKRVYLTPNMTDLEKVKNDHIREVFEKLYKLENYNYYDSSDSFIKRQLIEARHNHFCKANEDGKKNIFFKRKSLPIETTLTTTADGRQAIEFLGYVEVTCEKDWNYVRKRYGTK